MKTVPALATTTATTLPMQQEIYWENLAKRSLCRFLLLAQLDQGPIHGYGINQAIKEACQGCCEPTEAMVYSTMKELIDGGLVLCRNEEHRGRMRRVCWLTPIGRDAFKAAARVWQKMTPTLEKVIAQALDPTPQSSANGNPADQEENT